MKFEFKNPANFRDLGGIAAADGRRIKPCRLLRSGQLTGLTDAEINALTEDFGLRLIIDLRMGSEAAAEPDVGIAGAEYVNLDIFSGAEELVVDMENFGRVRTVEEAERFMQTAYDTMISYAGAQQRFAKFLRLARENKNGALLFHCFAGKDRTGVAAAMLLTLLGASREDIMKDYMLTNKLRRERNAQMMAETGAAAEDIQLQLLDVALNVRREYLAKAMDMAADMCGSFEGYMRQKLGVSDEDIKILRENYLE